MQDLNRHATLADWVPEQDDVETNIGFPDNPLSSGQAFGDKDLVNANISISLPTPEISPASMYKIKAHLVLLNSDSEDWGLVADIPLNEQYVKGRTSPNPVYVGTWSKGINDDIIRLSVETPLQALQDRAVQTFKKISDERDAAKSIDMPVKTRKPRISKSTSKSISTSISASSSTSTSIHKDIPPIQDKDQEFYDSLKAKFAKFKK